MSKVCPKCGGTEFIAHQVIRAEILVDSDNNFIGNIGETLESNIYDSEKPYGPYTCNNCGAEFDELTELLSK